MKQVLTIGLAIAEKSILFSKDKVKNLSEVSQGCLPAKLDDELATRIEDSAY